MKPPLSKTNEAVVPDFLSGGGEMDDLIRSIDWTKTSLGPFEKWPQSLRTSASICLSSNFPICIYWGEQHVLIYNHAWSAIPGRKHPWALGKTGQEVWPEIWNDIEPWFNTAFKGEPVGSNDQLLFMERHGYAEECYFDFTFTPIYGEGGKVEGVFNAVIETTKTLLNARQLQTLRDLSNLNAVSKNAEDIFFAAAKALEKNNKDFPFALIYKINTEGTTAKPVAYAGLDESQTSFPCSIDLLHPTEGNFNFCKAFDTGQIVVSENNCRRKVLPKGGWDKEATHFIHIPIRRQGHNRPFAIISAALNPYRKFDEVYQQFIELAADQISTELNNVLAIEEERKRAEALAEIDKAKTAFFTNISHEFRTPLTLILGSLEELLQKRSEALGKENKVAVETTHRNAMRLLRLVNNLLDFSRIESGKNKAQYQLTDIAKSTTDLASNFRSIIESAGLAFFIHTDTVIQPVYLDKEMWEKIVLNLLSNAFKYTLEGSITLSLDTAPLSKTDSNVRFPFPSEEGEPRPDEIGEVVGVRLRVTDTGVGIPENELPKMFQRFHRVQNVVGRTYEGTGIGLSLVSELVKLHGGEISVTSKEGEGTEFTVSIPIGKAHLPKNQVIDKEIDFNSELAQSFIDEAITLIEQPISKNGNETQANLSALESSTSPLHAGWRGAGGEVVLVVDDNADMRAYIKNLLQKEYTVITANNGMEALHQIKTHSPQLIVSDIMMPIMDGLQLLKEIKDSPQTRNIPIILLSARAGDEAKVEGYDIGADDYLIKPFSAKELVARVRANIKMATLRTQAESQLYNLLMQSPVAIAIYRGPNFIVELANDKMLEFYGKSAGEIINRPVFEVFPEVAHHGVKALHQKVFETGETVTAKEQRHEYYKNGTLYNGYFDTVMQPLRDVDGNITSIIVTGHEITEEVTARKKIEESEQQLRIALDGGELGAYNFYPQTGVLFWSEKTKEFFGLPPEAEVDYSVFLKGLHPNDRERSDAAIQKAMNPKSGGLYENEYRTVGLTDGKLRWIRSKGKVSFNEEGEPIRFTGVTQDITKQKETLASLQIQSLVLQRMDEGVSVSDEEGRIVLTNPAEDTMFGYAAGELIGKNVTIQNAYPPEENEKIVASVINQLKSKGFWSGEWHNRKKDGTEFYTFSYITSVSVDGKTRFVCVQRDITEEKKTRDALIESEERFRNLADESPMFVFIVNPDLQATVNYWNKTWLDYTGQTAEEAAGRVWDSIVHPHDVPLVMEIYTAAFLNKQPFFIPAVRTKRYNGEYRWHSYKGNPRYTATGEFNGYVGVGFDVHEQKIVEEKLAYRSALLEAHNQASVDGILLVDAKGKIISYNQRFVEIWNMPQHIVDAKDDEAALSFAMTQLVNPQQFIDKVNYLYDHPTATSLDELEYKDGKIVERYGYPVIGEYGTYYAWSWTFKDITERKKIEQELKNAKDQLELTFKNIPAGIYLINQKGEMVYVNDKGAAVYGDFTPKDLLEEKDLPALLKKADDLFERFDEKGNYFAPQNSPAYISLTTGQPSQTVLRQINRVTKEQRWHYVQGAPLFDEDGNVSMVLVTSTDITLQKVAEEKLKVNEERFRSLANSIPQLAWMADGDGWIFWYNEKWYEFTGTTPEEMEGWGWQSVHDLEKLPEVLHRWKNSIASGQPFEMVFPLKGADGKFRQFLTRVLPVVNNEGKIHQWFGTNTDITEQVNAKDELKKIKDQLELTFQNVPSALYHFDKNGNISYLNELGAKQLGYETIEEVLAEKDVYHLKRRLDETFIILNEKGLPLQVENSSVAICFRTGKASESVSQFIHRQTGKSHWYLSNSSPLFDENGALFMVLSTSTDITLQKTSEEAIRQSEERFRTLAETLPQMIWVRNMDGVIEYGSKSWEDYSGTKDVREAWTTMTHPDDWESIMSIWEKAVEDGKPFKYEVRLKNKFGEYRWHSAVGEPVKNADGKIIKWIGALTDNHEQKTLSEKLEKLVAERTKELERSNEDLQQFAHVASHDLKEPVRKVKTFSSRLNHEFGGILPEKAKIYIDKMGKAADRMYTMIDGVLFYSSFTAMEQDYEQVDLNEIFKNIETDLEIMIQQKKAVISFPLLPTIEGSPILLHQLFYNLVNNSLKFCNEEVAPLIEISFEKLNKAEIAKYNLPGKEHIAVFIKDNGIGFDQSNGEKIFKTFSRLNSKDKYEGTGLGLSLCKKIVERHGGTIEAEGKECAGAVFKIILPTRHTNQKEL